MNSDTCIDRTDAPIREEVSLQSCWLVVIHRQEASIYRSLAHDARAERIQSSRTQAALRRTTGVEGFFRRPERPAPGRFLEPLAHAIQEAPRLIVFGGGTGVANHMDEFVTWLNVKHPDLAQRILACLIVDSHHLSEAQMLARARSLYLRRRAFQLSTP